MSAVTLGNIGQLPKSERPSQDVNYRALTSGLLRLRAELPKLWAEVPEEERATLYAAALKAGTVRPTAWQIMKVTPRVAVMYARLQRAGKFGDFLDYARTLDMIWDDILSLSENDNPAFQRDLKTAFEDACTPDLARPALRSRQDVDEWLRSLI